ncbi:MAG: hypothetical protein IJ229_03390 [Clostridia bacterium]|nr:hypothetical protein [Clostridia bacterium]MBR1683799.1 hypothetical protein [Clostridia bacterium]MBR2288774.1 hypothetical protein [Clostridia bacterium]
MPSLADYLATTYLGDEGTEETAPEEIILDWVAQRMNQCSVSEGGVCEDAASANAVVKEKR